MDLLYNLNAKRSREPISRTTPHYHKTSTFQKTSNPNEKTIYNSWLAVLPVLAVFFGRRSKEIVSEYPTTRKQIEHTLMNIWKNTTLCDCDVSEKLIQLLIVADGELKMTWDDTGLLVVTSGVTGQFQNFGSEVLEDCSEVDRGT
jgi:hypothetical protein